MNNRHFFVFSESQLNWLIKAIERYSTDDSFDELMLDDLYDRLTVRDSNALLLFNKDLGVLLYFLNKPCFAGNPLASRVRSIISVI